MSPSVKYNFILLVTLLEQEAPGNFMKHQLVLADSTFEQFFQQNNQKMFQLILKMGN